MVEYRCLTLLHHISATNSLDLTYVSFVTESRNLKLTCILSVQCGFRPYICQHHLQLRGALLSGASSDFLPSHSTPNPSLYLPPDAPLTLSLSNRPCPKAKQKHTYMPFLHPYVHWSRPHPLSFAVHLQVISRSILCTRRLTAPLVRAACLYADTE